MFDGQAITQFLSGARVYDLSVPLFAGMPVALPHPPYTMALQRRHGDVVRDHGRSSANEVIVMCGHTGTHIDALGHFSRDGGCYGGRSAQEIQTGIRGLKELDIASVAPILCRGVLLDIAALKGVDVLPAGYAITDGDLAEAERRQGVTVQEGDAVLIRTGWIAYFDDVARFRGLDTGTPGPDPSAAEWLAARRVRVTGDETISYEVIRPGDEWLPVHPALLVDFGIHIIEVMNLEALARDGVHEFLFVCSPLRFVGGTGSPIRPLAVTWR